MSCLYTCLLFDWMVTLPQEYERFWKRKWNVSTFLFFLNSESCKLLRNPAAKGEED